MPDHRLTPEIETVLRASRIEGNTLTLQGQLQRPLYEKVAAFLLNCGGKWQRVRGCHVFDKPVAWTSRAGAGVGEWPSTTGR